MKSISKIIDGDEVYLWPPSGHEGWTISDSEGWLDGVFDSEESAIMGFKLSQCAAGYAKLSAICKKVNHIDRENRLITCDDFNA